LQRGSNAEYWCKKILLNRKRDRRVTQLLQKQGWIVIRIWETDILRAPDAAVARVRSVLRSRKGRISPAQAVF
jgi:G:T-mismatch repair DNA endonuclease (very short patch repair protein)